MMAMSPASQFIVSEQRPIIGFNVASWNLVPGYDQIDDDDDIEECYRSIRDLLLDDRGFPMYLRFLEPGIGAKSTAEWYPRGLCKKILRIVDEESHPILWCMFNSNVDAPTNSEHPHDLFDAVARELRKHDSDWCHKVVANTLNLLPSSAMIEVVNPDLWLPGTIPGEGPLLTRRQVIALRTRLWYQLIPKNRIEALSGGFYYDYRDLDCEMRLLTADTKLVSEFNADVASYAYQDGRYRAHMLRLSRMVGYMQARGIRKAYIHEAASRGDRFSTYAWDFEPTHPIPSHKRFSWYCMHPGRSQILPGVMESTSAPQALLLDVHSLARRGTNLQGG